ncbi:putative ribonuclease H-like domain-containing protein [Tanacetum coccineum]
MVVLWISNLAFDPCERWGLATKASDNASQGRKETRPVKDYILLPLWTADPPYSQDPKSFQDDGSKPSSDDGKKVDDDPREESESNDQEKEDNVNRTNNVNVASINEVNIVGEDISIELQDDLKMPALEDISINDFITDEEDDGAEADMNNLDTTIQVSLVPTTRIHKDHPLDSVIGDLQFATQTRKMTKNLEEHGTHTQEEGIDYDEVFASVARIKEIRLFLAYASFKDFAVYQMDVKSAFLNGKIEEEVYVYQPPGFEDPNIPNRVYKVEKSLYGLHQAPRAWYETLSIYLLDNGCQRGKNDKTLFIKRHKGDILLVQVYVDDIIFGSTKKELCIAFEKLIHEKFQMSSMGELTFFLGLQVKQKKDGIFISQDKYVARILKKFGFTNVKTTSTPMETQKPLLKDKDGEEVDVYMYRLMIGSLMYLTPSRSDIMFAVYACARYQVNPKVSHLHAVKRIFRYLKGQPRLGLWYPKDSPFDLVAYTDSDYAGASLDRKSTTGGCQFLGCRLISWQCKKQTVVANSPTEAKYMAASSSYGQVLWIQNQLLDYGYNFMHTKILIDNNSMLRNLDNVSSKILMYPRFVQFFMNQQVEGMPTHKRKYVVPYHTKKVFRNMKRVGKDFSGNVTPLFPTMVVQHQTQTPTITQTSTPTTTTIPTSTQTPTTIQPTISIQPLQKKHPRKPKRKVTKVPQPSEPVNVADKVVRKEWGDRLVRAATTASSLEVEQDSGNIDKTQSKAIPNEPGSQGTSSGGGPRCQEPIGGTSAQTSLERRVKKLERSKKSRSHKLKRLYKVGLTARIESFEEEDLGKDASKQGRISAIDADDDITLVSPFVDEEDVEIFDKDEDVAANTVVKEVNVNEEVVEEVNTAKLIVDAAKVSAAGVAKTISAAQPTTAAATIEVITLTRALQKMKSTTPKAKGVVIQEREQDQIRLDEETTIRLQAEFDEEERIAREEAQNVEKANIALIEEWDNIQAKIDTDYHLAERLQAKEQEELSVDDSTNTTELKELMKIIPDEEEVAIDVIPLAVKSPKTMLKSFVREDLEDLYKLVKAKYGSTRLVVDLDLLLWGDLKTMFEPHVEDNVWRQQQGVKVLNWKLYDSCEVHSLMLQSTQIYMLVEKKYLLTPPTLMQMLKKKLIIDYESEMAYQLVKSITK